VSHHYILVRHRLKALVWREQLPAGALLTGKLSKRQAIQSATHALAHFVYSENGLRFPPRDVEQFIDELEQTRTGTAQLQSRAKLFGECKRREGETSAEFYAKLHHWLERKMPQTKSPPHPPRQAHRGSTS
jgi:hypothetical protein